jgi:adenylosuccinate synthase
MFAGPTCLAILHLDTLSGIDTLRVCVGYKAGGGVMETFVADAGALEAAKPVYERVPGWEEDIGGCRRFEDLPEAARNYVRLVSERLATPVRMIGVGPARDQVILMENGA